LVRSKRIQQFGQRRTCRYSVHICVTDQRDSNARSSRPGALGCVRLDAAASTDTHVDADAAADAEAEVEFEAQRDREAEVEPEAETEGESKTKAESAAEGRPKAKTPYRDDGFEQPAADSQRAAEHLARRTAEENAQTHARSDAELESNCADADTDTGTTTVTDTDTDIYTVTKSDCHADC
jgi:hypothetical protein